MDEQSRVLYELLWQEEVRVPIAPQAEDWAGQHGHVDRTVERQECEGRYEMCERVGRDRDLSSKLMEEEDVSGRVRN